MEKMVIGIDIGGTYTKFGFVSETGELSCEGSLQTDKHPKVEDFIDELCGKLLALQEKGKYEIMGIGVGAPDANYYTGAIENAPNLKWKGFISLSGLFKQHFNLPVAVTNDANAAALGELIYGNGKGMKHFIMITLGTGLGSGFVVDGKVVYGHDGFAGELGHVIAIPEGRQCACGKKGTKIPDPETAVKINEKCFHKGLLMFAPVGIGGECIKIAPPLIITAEALKEGIKVLEEACDEILKH